VPSGRLVRRLADAAAAALALVLVAQAVPALRAEYVYGSALGYARPATDDLPGRLAAYEEAARIDPGEAVYHLRSGELRLRRAKSQPGARRDQIDAALEHFRNAVRLNPLDARSRNGLAQALAARGESEAALEQVAASVRLGPSMKGVMARAIQTYLDAWERTGDGALLREALRLTRRVSELDEGYGRMLAGLALRRSARDVQGDALEALVAYPDLAREAATVLRPVLPDVAAVLRSVAGGEDE
jgi:tetratricopeptide (TPR) repeat protein